MLILLLTKSKVSFFLGGLLLLDGLCLSREQSQEGTQMFSQQQDFFCPGLGRRIIFCIRASQEQKHRWLSCEHLVMSCLHHSAHVHVKLPKSPGLWNEEITFVTIAGEWMRKGGEETKVRANFALFQSHTESQHPNSFKGSKNPCPEMMEKEDISCSFCLKIFLWNCFTPAPSKSWQIQRQRTDMNQIHNEVR